MINAQRFEFKLIEKRLEKPFGEKKTSFNFVFLRFFSSQDTGITVKSYPLTVDTSQAIKMKPENEDNANELSTNAEQSIDKFEYAENYRRRLISASDAENQYKSLMLGVVAALVVFLFILTVFCASRRNDGKTIDTHPIYSQQSNELLNEVIVNRS